LKPNNPADILPSLPRGAEVLIIRLRSLGDVVMLTPALAALHAWRPDLRLNVLVEPPFVAVLEGNPAVAEILEFRGFLSAALALRRRKFPVTFNQHGGPTSAFLTAAIVSPFRVCWAHGRYGLFYNVRVPDKLARPKGRRLHTVEHRVTQFLYTGLPAGSLPRPQVFPNARAQTAVQQMLKEKGVAPGTPYAVLHPGAAYFTKRWAMDHFADAARWMREKHSIVPVTILGPGDREIAAEALRGLSALGPILDSLSMRELIALVAGGRMFLGNDSGPAHLAAAAGLPVAVIFGSSDSVTWRPWQSPHRVVQNDFPCNPCRGDRCYAFDEPRCILSISPEQVREACDSLLAETAG
jgi:ADP-heptose:LPS heptosyltransferase